MDNSQKLEAATGYIFELLSRVAAESNNEFQKQCAILRVKFDFIWGGLPPTPVAAAASVEPSPPVLVHKEVDKKLPMFVWRRASKGYTCEYWPQGEAAIGATHREGVIQSYNVEPEHAGLTLSELALQYPLPATAFEESKKAS